MSVEAAEPSANGTETQVADNPGMGGTSTEGEVRSDGVEVIERKDETKPEGAEPEGEEGAEEEVSSAAQAELEELREFRAQMLGVGAALNRNPKLAQAVQREMTGADPAGEEDNLSKAEAAIGEWFQDTAENPARTAVSKFVTPLIEEVKTLREQIRGMRPALDRAYQSASQGAFSKSVAEHGGPALSDKGFLKHLSELRKDPNFVQDERRRPEYAGKFAAVSWRAKSGQQAFNAASRARVEAVKNGRTQGAVVASNGTRQVHVIDKSVPNWDNRLRALMEAAEKSGKPLHYEFKKKS